MCSNGPSSLGASLLRPRDVWQSLESLWLSRLGDATGVQWVEARTPERPAGPRTGGHGAELASPTELRCRGGGSPWVPGPSGLLLSCGVGVPGGQSGLQGSVDAGSSLTLDLLENSPMFPLVQRGTFMDDDTVTGGGKAWSVGSGARPACSRPSTAPCMGHSS